VATGCGAGALMRHGFMDPANVEALCGDGLKAVLTAVGLANDLGGPLPPVLHMGSCVDNSRAVALTVAVAQYLGVDHHQLPIVARRPRRYRKRPSPSASMPWPPVCPPMSG